MSPLSVAVAGPGKVGTALIQQIEEAGWKLEYTIPRVGIYNAYKELILPSHELDHPKLPRVDLVFVTTPSSPVEHYYLAHYTRTDTPVVSSAKYTLSCRFDSVRRKIRYIGYYAMVGGGTCMIDWIRDRMRGRRDVTMHAVLNGTLCFIFDQMDREKLSLGQAVERAQRLGYAEPGATFPLGVIMGEIRDTALKGGVVSNLCLDLPSSMCAEKIDEFRPFAEDELAQVVEEAHERRYIVSFLPEGTRTETDIIGGYTHQLSNGMRISAGFKNVRRNPLLTNLVLQNANNAVLTCEGPDGRNGVYMGPSGPGAGPHETAGAMVIHARKMMKNLFNRHC